VALTRRRDATRLQTAPCLSMRARILFVSAAAALSCPASAQPVSSSVGSSPDRWLVIPSTTGGAGNPAHAARSAARLVREQLDARGRPVLRAEESRRLFEQRGSAPPIAITASAVDELARDAQQALYHVASGLHSRAQQDVERAMERARVALESLNRENRAARHLLDACMFLVRGQLERRDRDRAKKQALECRRLVPDIAPDPTMHPPNVIGVLAEAEADLLSRAPSSLRIEGQPSGCAVLINGRNLGTTPKELSRLSSGEYRIQVECDDGEPGRVHRVVLNSSRAVVRIDTRFDRVVQTAFDLSLRYDSSEAEQDQRAADALEAARIVGASDLVLVSLTRESPTRLEVALQRLRVNDGALVAETRLVLAGDGTAAADAVKVAVGGLLDGIQPPAIVAESMASSPLVTPVPEAVSGAAVEEGEGSPARDARPDRVPAGRVAGYVSAGIGAAASITGWILYGHHASLQSDYAEALNADSPERFDAYRRASDFDAVPSVVLGLGSGALALGAQGYLPQQPAVPWWAWVSGALGVGLAGVGLKLALDAGSCLEDSFGRCTEPGLATRVGTLLLLQSMPFVSLPITYGVRALLGERATVSASARAHGAYFVLGGVL
jgi:hypothetical protein